MSCVPRLGPHAISITYTEPLAGAVPHFTLIRDLEVESRSYSISQSRETPKVKVFHPWFDLTRSY